MKRSFSAWVRWKDRTTLSGLSFPGVYVIAISASDISGTDFAWIPEIVYVGMTNAKGGLKSRLAQFDNAIKGGDQHGGAHRVRYKHPHYSNLAPRLYVSVKFFECDVISNKSSDLRIMGEVAQHEYECFARFVDRFGALPEFNDKKRSPKK